MTIDPCNLAIQRLVAASNICCFAILMVEDMARRGFGARGPMVEKPKVAPPGTRGLAQTLEQYLDALGKGTDVTLKVKVGKVRNADLIGLTQASIRMMCDAATRAVKVSEGILEMYSDSLENRSPDDETPPNFLRHAHTIVHTLAPGFRAKG